MRGRLAAAAAVAVLAAGGAALGGASPAGAIGSGSGSGGIAGAGSGTGGWCTGPTCHVHVIYTESGSGTTSTGTTAATTTDLPPPPPPPPPACQWMPIGDQAAGSKYIVSQYGGLTGSYPQRAEVKQAKGLLQQGSAAPGGTWYRLQVNNTGTAAQNAACAKLPPLAFALTGQEPPATPISVAEVLDTDIRHFTLPRPYLTLNPDAGAYVNLATFVWWGAPQIGSPAQMPYKYAITGRAGPVRATVVAELQSATIKVSGNGIAVSSGCQLRSGSQYQPDQLSAFGPGRKPDCGVLWTSPSPDATITVVLHWGVVYHTGSSPAFSGTPVPGAPNGIDTATTTGQLAVRDIQSVNGA